MFYRFGDAQCSFILWLMKFLKHYLQSRISCVLLPTCVQLINSYTLLVCSIKGSPSRSALVYYFKEETEIRKKEERKGKITSGKEETMTEGNPLS